MELLTTREVALMFGVHSGTVANWAKAGLIPVIQLPSGRRRYPADAIRAFFETVENE
ncbi:helix-turn-helix domain-containing protein [Actinomadura atramentaria]|uniref:helix-turn-helix domain-containing protein n=1 Tax=Actinomadura atramentaria TaxID=1990 RepID=UPI000361D3F9|nr:helix-turn-helix domain-containing protein [Actinomadura atramentaria]